MAASIPAKLVIANAGAGVRSCLLPQGAVTMPRMSRPLRLEFAGAVYHGTSQARAVGLQGQQAGAAAR